MKGRAAALRGLAGALIVLALAFGLAACQALEPLPPGEPQPGLARQDLLIPVPSAARPMLARLHLPPGEGPFPLAIVNHGSDQDPVARRRMQMPEFPRLTEWLLARGHAVLLPLRPGHGRAGGPYLEDQRGCARADYLGSGLATASLIEAAIRHMRDMKFIRSDGTIVIGTSAGGWGAMALASRNPAGVAAYVSFAGGRGGRNMGRAGDNCAPERLIAAARQFGARARVPGLWIHAENDSWFAPGLVHAMAEAYRAGGAPLDLQMLPAGRGEGHFLIHEPEMRWAQALERFLSDIDG